MHDNDRPYGQYVWRQHKNVISKVEIEIIDIPIMIQNTMKMLHLWPLLLTWFNFNPSMDK